MFEINVTIHCPDLVAAAKLLAKCTGTAASEVPAAPAPVVAPSAPAEKKAEDYNSIPAMDFNPNDDFFTMPYEPKATFGEN